MKTKFKFITLLFILTPQFILADCDFISYFIKVEIYMNSGEIVTGYIDYIPDAFYLSNVFKQRDIKPITGKNLLYVNKLGAGDSLMYSDSLYSLGGFNYAVTKKLPMNKVRLIIAVDDNISNSSYSSYIPWVTIEDAEIMQSLPLVFIQSFEVDCKYITYVNFSKSLSKDLFKEGSEIDILDSPAFQEAIKRKGLFVFWTNAPCGC